MSSRSRTSLIAKLLRNKQYRDAYVAEHVRNGVPFQIRTMRDQREWTQTRLGQEAGKPQNVISRLEDPNYGKVTIQTLLEIASAFDVALIVKFVPFSRLLKEYENVSPAALAVLSIQNETPQLEAWASNETISPAIQSSADTTDIASEVSSSQPRYRLVQGTSNGLSRPSSGQRGLYPVGVLNRDAEPSLPSFTPAVEFSHGSLTPAESTNPNRRSAYAR